MVVIDDLLTIFFLRLLKKSWMTPTTLFTISFFFESSRTFKK